jgi:RHS repeat-associated protein
VTLGRFINRDPIGYVDGPNVYQYVGGNVTNETAAVDHLFGYTGRAYDEETDLQNNHNRWYDAANGKWLSEDPIGFAAGDANLYRYVGNSATGAIDPDGLVLVAIDGTVSKSFRESPAGYDGRSRRYRSHTRNFYEDYELSRGEWKFYFDGPCDWRTGSDADNIHRGVMKVLLPILKTNPNETINIVGHSRGGYIGMEVARELKKLGYRVNFLGLYDAVDMAPGYGEAETIPSNVDNSAHAMGHWVVGSRWWFNTADHGPEDRSKMKSCRTKSFVATHGGIGGAPWYGDRPRGMLKSIDERQSRAVDEWMRMYANEDGNITLTPSPLPPPR